MTVEQLVAIIPSLNCCASESYRIGMAHGLTRHDVQSLRHMLGFSSERLGGKLSQEQKEAIIQEYEEGGTSVLKIAKKYGVSYNSIYCILKGRHVDTQNPRLWSHIKEMRLVDCVKKGMSTRSIASLMGKSRTSIERKIERMRKAGKV